MLYALMLVGLTARTVAETGTAASAAPCVDKTDKCSLEQWVSLCTDGAGSETSTDNSIHKLASCTYAGKTSSLHVCTSPHLARFRFSSLRLAPQPTGVRTIAVPDGL